MKFGCCHTSHNTFQTPFLSQIVIFIDILPIKGRCLNLETCLCVTCHIAVWVSTVWSLGQVIKTQGTLSLGTSYNVPRYFVPWDILFVPWDILFGTCENITNAYLGFKMLSLLINHKISTGVTPKRFSGYPGNY